MAENKKSFILYCDLIHTFKELSDTEAGQLIKHVLSYVNDENPEMDDRLLNLVFEPIKQQLKRDLIKYEDIKDFRSEIGKAGGIKISSPVLAFRHIRCESSSLSLMM